MQRTLLRIAFTLYTINHLANAVLALQSTYYRFKKRRENKNFEEDENEYQSYSGNVVSRNGRKYVPSEYRSYHNLDDPDDKTRYVFKDKKPILSNYKNKSKK
jgi:hypothetical protein